MGPHHPAAAQPATPTPRRGAQGMIFNEMRSKTKCMLEPIESLDPKDFPDWSYDGSSTGQASGNNSDCIIK
jgi:glutamine synthetase